MVILLVGLYIVICLYYWLAYIMLYGYIVGGPIYCYMVILLVQPIYCYMVILLMDLPILLYGYIDGPLPIYCYMVI